MGSSSGSKKKNDSVALSPLYSTGVGSEGGYFDKKGKGDEICVLSFRIKLDNTKLLKAGQKLSFNKSGDIMVLGNVVGTITKHFLNKITKCTDHGYLYTVEVITKNNMQKELIYYAEFTRTYE